MTKPASKLATRPRRPLQPLARLCRWLPGLGALAGVMLSGCNQGPEPYVLGEPIVVEQDRFMRAIHAPDPVEEEPPPEDQANSDEEAGGSGQRHRGEEGVMGRPTSRSKSGLYAMKGPRDAIPQMASACADCDTDAAKYSRAADNAWAQVNAEPLSTFSIDVDTASYSNVRRYLEDGMLPPPDAVRTEELINYFDYDYAAPGDDSPLAVHAEVAPCPWNTTHKLVHIGMQGKIVPVADMGPRNLVFLVDVSGSMESVEKLPLLRHGLRMLVADMRAEDRISMVAYAGASGLVLPPTSGADKQTILHAIDNLAAGGSTNGGAGIALAYAQARKHFIQGGVNRVILASDGDFNVGVTDHNELVRLVEQQRASGVFLSVLGFGSDNINDHTMEQLADKGNGNYAYIDSEREAKKVLVDEAAGTLVTIAQDVKMQVEWNPGAVAAYRLIGYENRRLATQDFTDDRKDAGELGAGHSVTGLYEIVPAGTPVPGGRVGALKYQRPVAVTAGTELLTVKVRYKQPEGATSRELALSVKNKTVTGEQTSDNFRMAAAVAAFGQRLRDPQGTDGLSFAEIHQLASGVTRADPHGYRTEFLRLVLAAGELARGAKTESARAPVAPLNDDELG